MTDEIRKKAKACYDGCYWLWSNKKCPRGEANTTRDVGCDKFQTQEDLLAPTKFLADELTSICVPLGIYSEPGLGPDGEMIFYLWYLSGCIKYWEGADHKKCLEEALKWCRKNLKGEVDKITRQVREDLDRINSTADRSPLPLGMRASNLEDYYHRCVLLRGGW